MEINELKFLLKLLGFPDYRALLSRAAPNSIKVAAEREQICHQLRDRQLVDCSYEVTKLKIAPPGKAILKLDPTGLPLTEWELKVLRMCEKGGITPGRTGVPTTERQAIIQGLADRGLIELETKIKEVWLSQGGQEFLRDEFNPKGSAYAIALNLVGNYLRFLRTSLRVQPDSVSPSTTALRSQLTDEQMLQMIRDLDRQLVTGNYLPIFHLRQKLQPPLSREDLDRALYRLQRNDQIELSALVHSQDYTQEQTSAGIRQLSGSQLFFIKVTEH